MSKNGAEGAWLILEQMDQEWNEHSSTYMDNDDPTNHDYYKEPTQMVARENELRGNIERDIPERYDIYTPIESSDDTIRSPQMTHQHHTPTQSNPDDLSVDPQETMNHEPDPETDIQEHLPSEHHYAESEGLPEVDADTKEPTITPLESRGIVKSHIIGAESPATDKRDGMDNNEPIQLEAKQQTTNLPDTLEPASNPNDASNTDHSSAQRNEWSSTRGYSPMQSNNSESASSNNNESQFKNNIPIIVSSVVIFCILALIIMIWVCLYICVACLFSCLIIHITCNNN